MTDSLIKDVSDTAFMVAHCRALESARADALFHDPLAGRLAGEHGRKIVESMFRFRGGWSGAIRARGMAWNVALRTHIIDEFILSAIAQGADAVLNLGAGLDSRPYRMTLPVSFDWIEVDYPHIIEFKQSRLADQTPRCRLERIKLDLADLPARRQLFSQLNGRFKDILVITEGVVLYLSVDAAAELADDLRSQTSFRHWVVDYFSPEMLRIGRRSGFQRQLANAPFLFAPRDYFGFFSEHGWGCGQIRYLWDDAKQLRRPMPLPFIAQFLFALRRIFMSRQRREALRKFIAYVLFEPVPPKS